MAADPTEITNTEISGLLKRSYSKYRVNTFPITTPLMASLKKGSKGGPNRLRWTGEGVRGDAVLTRPQGMTSSTRGFLPKNHIARERQFDIGIKRLYVTRELDGLTITGTQDKKGAYLSIVRKCLNEIKDACSLGMQEIAHGNGQAIKAVITVVTDTDTITVSHPYGLTGSGEGGMLIDTGLEVAVIDVDGGNAVLGRSRIESVINTGDNAAVELETAIAGMEVGDYLVSCTDNDTAFGTYPHGLQQILNRGGAYDDFLGINAATDPRWNATTLVAGTDTPSAERVTESDIWRLFAKVAARSGKDATKTPNQFLMLTTPGLQLRVMETYLGQRSFDPKDMMDIPGGFKAVRINGVPLIADAFCPAGTIYLVHLPSLLWIDAKDWGYVTFEGAGPWRWIDGRDAYQTNYGSYMNLACSQRNAHGMITGYTDTERFSHVM